MCGSVFGANSTVSMLEPFHPPVETFKGFDQSHQHGLANNLHLDHEDDFKRGASRANSVRFDESSMHGYYSQVNRSASELPVRTGSGLSHPLTERSLSHRSDGRQSSSGQSHRTFSGLDSSKVEGSNATATATQPALTPPPGLFILGPVPSIIRCWLTTNFSNDSLLYAAVCTGSYKSIVTSNMVQRLGLEGEMGEDDGVQTIKLPVYLPEASVYQPSSRSPSPNPQVPALTIRFAIRDDASDDRCIQIFIGSDILRAHNADILFSQDKILIVDDERNRISVPLVRPEDHSSFKSLSTGPQGTFTAHEIDGEKALRQELPSEPSTEERTSDTHRASPVPRRFPKSTLTLRTSTESFDTHGKTRSAHFADESDDNGPDRAHTRSTTGEKSADRFSKTEGTGVWGPWRRDTSSSSVTTPITTKPESPYLAAASQRPARPRNMKVLKPSRQPSGAMATAPHSAVEPSSTFRMGEFSAHRSMQSTSGVAVDGEDVESSRTSGDGGSRLSKPRTANPIGGASAFGWLNSKPSGMPSDS